MAQYSLNLDERRYYREWWLAASVSLAVMALLTVLQWGQSFGYVIYDQFQRWWPATPGSDVVVIAVDDHTLNSRGGWPLKRSDYAQLLQMLADSGNQPKAIGFDILFPDPMPEDFRFAEQIRRHHVFLAEEQIKGVVRGVAPARHFNSTLALAAEGMAQVNLSFESDGSLRGTHLLNNGVPQLALLMSGKAPQDYASHDSYRRFHMVDPAVGFPTASLADVLSGQVPLAFFKNRYVLVGSTAPSLGDHFPIMYSGKQAAGTPGVVLHANLLNGLLQGQLIAPLPLPVQILLCSLILMVALVALLVLSPLVELLVTLGVVLCTLQISFGILFLTHLWFDPGLCVMAVLLLKPVWAWRRSEMIVNFMAERAARLTHIQSQRKTIGRDLRWHHLTSDTLLQYSRLLDKAIEAVNGRLVFLQRVVSQMPVAMLVADVQEQILLTNPRMLQDLPQDLAQHGRNLQPLIDHLGLPPLSLSMLSERDRMVSGVDATGAVRHFIFRVTSILQDNEIHLWVLSLTDVTEMRQFQAQRDRTLQLLSHDMRTPVASIIALCRQPLPSASNVVTETAFNIRRHARTLLNMMDDFIFSIQAQAPHYKLVELLLDTLVDEAIYQVQDLAKAKNMQLVQDIADMPQFVMADQRLLTRVLVNLLNNAIRYGAQDSDICIRITHDDMVLPDPHVRCSVTNVVGDPLSDASRSLNTGNSFGLGLDFVQTVIQKHNGQLHMKLGKTPGTHASVELALPLVL